MLLAGEIGTRLELKVDTACVTKARDVPELKNLHEYSERVRALAGAFAVDATRVKARKLLLLDDLFRSGATMNAITAALYEQGEAEEVFALAITRTRSRQ